jgi:hypothetical protein
MDTIAAMPSTMDIEKSRSFARLRRLSRQAIRKNHFAPGRLANLEKGADISGMRAFLHHATAL